MWYGIKVDGEIVWVQWFSEEPTLKDFLYPNREEFTDLVEIIRVEISEWKDRSYETRESGDNSWYQ